jgi:DNA-binding phage protein
MTLKTFPFDVSDYLAEDETIVEFLTDALESDDPVTSPRLSAPSPALAAA